MLRAHQLGRPKCMAECCRSDGGKNVLCSSALCPVQVEEAAFQES